MSLRNASGGQRGRNDAHFHDLSQSHSFIVMSSWRARQPVLALGGMRMDPHWLSGQRAASGGQQWLGCSLGGPQTKSPSPMCCSCIRAAGSRRSLDSSHVNASMPPGQRGRSPTCNDPVLPRDEAAGADGHVGKFESLDNRLGDVRPDVDVACMRQLSASMPAPGQNIPLYKVVRIHGSTGWKSLAVFSRHRSVQASESSYRFLRIVSTELPLHAARRRCGSLRAYL
jgi:hypothetical protein